MTPEGAESTAQLQAQLAAAIQAAREAYRHTTGLIRLLTVIGQPTVSEDLVEQTLIVLSEVFSADVTCVAHLVGGRLLVSSVCGLPEDDPAFENGWPVDPGSAKAFDDARLAGTGAPDPEVPPPLAQLGARSAAWVPLPDSAEAGPELLLLYRLDGAPFTPADLEVLRSVAHRLRLAVQAHDRGAAIERLAQSGHKLAGYLDLERLLDEAATLMRGLVAAEHAWVVKIDADRVTLWTGGGPPPPWPLSAGALPGWGAMARGQPYLDNDPDPATAWPAPGRALLGVPVMRAGAPIALLYAARGASRPFHRDAAEMTAVFANYLGAAIANAELYRALAHSEASLRKRATHDPLTGLANRVLARQRLEDALAGSAEDHVGLLFCDLDRFKKINDRLGHEAGDELLLQVSGRLRDSVRASDLLSRFGGDEFVVILDGVRDRAEIAGIGRRMVRCLDAPFTVYGEQVDVSASIGGALGVRGRATAAALLRHADAAMYAAKVRGPGRVEVFAEVVDPDAAPAGPPLPRAPSDGELSLPAAKALR
jgi:diguanylate cyclase (GGDEF)-like protein